MADEKEPKAITYKEVERAVGKDATPRETWEKIGMMVGAGRVPLNDDGDASIDLTGASDTEQKDINALLTKATEDKKARAAEAKKSTKEGAK